MLKPKKAKSKLVGLSPDSSTKEIKAHIQNVFDKNSKFQVDKITISTKAEKLMLIEQINQVEKLLKEYHPPEYLNYDKGTKVRFTSSKTTLGYIQTAKWKGDVWRETMNFGHKVSSPKSYDRIGTARFNSKVDLKNNNLSTTTHEFLHILSTSNSSKNVDFWKEIQKVRKEYANNLWELNKKKAPQTEIDKVYLGKYAGTNVDEFTAESFTEYKLTEKPSKYATKVGKIIDKYFKR